jgi:Spy/CpxP family protein refolding chaperone
MKKNVKLITAAAMGLATAAWAGQGMGADHCKNGGPQGPMMGRQMTLGGCAHEGRGEHRAPMMKKVLSRLDLSDSQRAQIRAIFLEEKKAKIERKLERIKEGKGMRRGPQGRHGVDLSRFMSRERFDKEAFKKAMQEKWTAQEKMRQARRAERLDRMADRMEKIFAVLTPEQREKLIEWSKKR